MGTDSKPLTREAAFQSVLEQVARMGTCSQTHHEWISAAARDALVLQSTGTQPLDVDRLREAARRVGLPFDVTVADIERLAEEYDRVD